MITSPLTLAALLSCSSSVQSFTSSTHRNSIGAFRNKNVSPISLPQLYASTLEKDEEATLLDVSENKRGPSCSSCLYVISKTI